MHITGSCHCGAIGYEAEVDPGRVSACHCTDCQVLTGTAYRLSIQALPGTFRLVRGTPRAYMKTADSGRTREQGFCERCGSPIYATSPGPGPRTYNVRLGTIHQRNELRPFRQIWTRSRLPWEAEIARCPDPGVDV